MTLKGFSGPIFGCDWSPEGGLLAAGGEDRSTRIFDMRLSGKDQAIVVLPANLAAVRSVRFSPQIKQGTGMVLAVMEDTDYVSFYTKNNTSIEYPDSFHEWGRNVVDFFGETSGIAFSPDATHCYIGCTDASWGGIIETTHQKNFSFKHKFILNRELASSCHIDTCDRIATPSETDYSLDQLSIT